MQVRLGWGAVGLPAQGYAKLSGRCALRADQVLLVVTRNRDVRKTGRPLLAMTATLDWVE